MTFLAMPIIALLAVSLTLTGFADAKQPSYSELVQSALDEYENEIFPRQQELKNEMFELAGNGYSEGSPEVQALWGEYQELQDRITESGKSVDDSINPTQKDNLEKGKQMVYDSEFKSHTLWTDYETMQLVIGVYDDKSKNQIASLLGEIPNRITVGEPTSIVQGSCTNDLCNPLIGAAKLQDDDFGLNATTTISATKDWLIWTLDGVVTAGHVYKNESTNGEIFQFDNDVTAHKVGSIFTRIFTTSCDCAFIESDSRSILEDKINIAGNDETLSGTGDSEANEIMYYVGGWTGFDSGWLAEKNAQATFTSYGVTKTFKNLDRATSLASQDGDSGGPSVDSNQDSLAGLLVGKDGSNRYFMPYSIVHSQLGLN